VSGFFRTRSELTQQAALPDPRLAGDEHETALAQRGDEGIHLRVATDDDRADVHVAILAGEG